MEPTSSEDVLRSDRTWFARLLAVTLRLRDYPIAASSILCIVVIVLSHTGHAGRASGPAVERRGALDTGGAAIRPRPAPPDSLADTRATRQRQGTSTE
jgi:hypothetical protein